MVSQKNENTVQAAPSKPSNMRVVVRVRPPNPLEISNNSGASSVRVMDQNVLVFDPDEECEAINFPGASRKRARSVTGRRARDLRFIFDRVFNEEANNTDVFENTTKDIIDGVLDGFNCTVFAYGATGAGKTHTMLGSNNNPGVMFLTMMDLYRRIHEMKDEKTCDVAVSYLEVYNETIRDLLLPGPALAVREDPQRGVCVSGLTLHKPHSAEELLSMLEFGNNNRTQHPTDANAQSSRSHAVFQVFVRQKDRTAGLKANVRLAKMSLIDLAGSERATVTTNRGARFREGANINKSLLALGNCINALADKENKSGHIPYRNSKLTRLLKDSLGGNCKTVMIAAVSPSMLSYEDTYNTLKYADRAKSIKVSLKRNVVSVDFHVSRYAKIVDELRTEITELKNKLSCYEGVDLPEAKPPASSQATDEKVTRLRNALQSIMSEREIIKKDMVDIEAAQKELMMKTFRKERNLERLRQVVIEEDACQEAACRMQKCLSVTKTKKKNLETRVRTAELKLQQNTSDLERVQQEINSLSEEVNDRLSSCQSALKAELKCAELRRLCRYYKKYAHAQEKDANNTERLVLRMLSAMKKQFFLLRGAGLATPDVTNDYDSIVSIVTEAREVKWADQSTREAESRPSYSEMINFDSTIDGTPVHAVFINDVKSPRISTPLQGNPSLNALLAPRHFTSQSSSSSPSLTGTRLSLNKQFDAVGTPGRSDPLTRQTLPTGPAMGDAPLLDANGDPPPLELISRRPLTPNVKVAWFDMPTRASGGSPGDQMACGSFTPTRSGALNSTFTFDKPPSSPLTPLRELSLNSRKVAEELHSAGLPSSYDSVKKAKVSEKPLRKRVLSNNMITSSLMIPKRHASSKENVVPSYKPKRNINRINQQKVQKHMVGLRRAISSQNSRSFAPRTTTVYENMKKTMI
ncbi:kinesin-like protein KIF18A isoform X2 [Nematostella vectensis]|uniref:kinesin-like protein KIF18A isoform X2 n=1 Tax=Nematostella vectensis TaxID=45351 RepID=UPI002077762F|nr:kinesin-like protein KIF18A isoform X2 [Nematostella vectensis]XP_048584607.1 kinesin-like protein KIF18A isoform X2 [Nematostella vectensis]